MTPNEILTKLQSNLPDVKFELQQGNVGDPWLLAQPNDIEAIIRYLKNELGMNYLACLSGVDYDSSFGVVYQLRSLQGKFEVMLKTLIAKENPVVATISHIYGCAEWFEREAFDLLGIQFKGHPDLRRIMMPDDWIGHPLRKDYQPPTEYHGIPCDRPDTHKLLDQLKPAGQTTVQNA